MLWIFWSWLGADLLCGSLRFGTGDAQWDAQLALEMQLGQHSAMGRCCSDSGAAALSLELHTGAWGWLGVQELLSPSFGKPWKRGGCFGKIQVWSSAQLPSPPCRLSTLWDGKGELQAAARRCGSPGRFRGAPCTLKGTKSHPAGAQGMCLCPWQCQAPPRYEAG